MRKFQSPNGKTIAFPDENVDLVRPLLEREGMVEVPEDTPETDGDTTVPVKANRRRTVPTE